MIDFIKDNSFIIAQAFGFLAMGVGISMYQFNKHRTVMLMMVLCALTWCCHYTFLG
ncbi:MAG: YgjV family protein, partial [Clostridia bacterium]|nr:YgjV family protein [Clostridia bacterium]